MRFHHHLPLRRKKPAPVDGTSSNDGDGEVPVEPVTTSDIITNAHKEAVKALLSDRTFKADTVLVALREVPRWCDI